MGVEHVDLEQNIEIKQREKRERRETKGGMVGREGGLFRTISITPADGSRFSFTVSSVFIIIPVPHSSLQQTIIPPLKTPPSIKIFKK